MRQTQEPERADRARDAMLGILPEGVGPPPDVPPAIFVAALQTFLELRRLDMRALAAELGMGRSSLYRKVSSRDHLLGAVLWYLTRRAIVRAVEATQDLSGPARVVGVGFRPEHVRSAEIRNSKHEIRNKING